MGGYYSEPDGNDDSSSKNTQNTHMVFGVRCVEQMVEVNPQTRVTLLRPIVDNNDEHQNIDPDGVLQHEIVLASYLLEHGQAMVASLSNDRRIVVVEEGPHRTGLISLALATALEGVTIVATASDLTKLNVIKSAQLFYGSTGSSGSSSMLETGTWSL